MTKEEKKKENERGRMVWKNIKAGFTFVVLFPIFLPLVIFYEIGKWLNNKQD